MRTIDGVERRRVLSKAVWSIIRREGFEAASVRAVAAETGLSTGSVRHFFATQDELHVFAMEQLIEEMTTRVRVALETSRSKAGNAQAWDARSTRKGALAVMLELLPLTKDREELFLAYLQFIVKATVHPVLRPMTVRLADETQQLVEHLVQSLVDTGAARHELDVRASAAAMNMLLDGITLRLLTAPGMLSAEEAIELVESLLDSWEMPS
ncbi:TetR/AcrR family transcriptional regulator [Paenarthrobacter sp. NPDC090517]|uniref:TetR/AcrR family transcriptional regulator n=1 Tax=Paenarthrobacter sp. NPDC090517 TaxID=3364381 RepID=UPI003820824F